MLFLKTCLAPTLLTLVVFSVIALACYPYVFYEDALQLYEG